LHNLHLIPERLNVSSVFDLSVNKSLLLLDEPFAALDALTRLTMQALVAELIGRYPTRCPSRHPRRVGRLGKALCVLTAVFGQRSTR
jgi:ABC-type phosphate transport system ATPase subunit